MTPDPIRLCVPHDGRTELATGRLALDTRDGPLAVELTVPAGPTTTEDILPVLQGLSDLFVARAKARVAREGKAISCRAGCAACCRQLVPVSGAEARHLARLVAAMPEPRRSQVRARFDAVLAALDAAGMLERLTDPAGVTAAGEGIDYLRLGLDCPFLDGGTCSIYADRPLTCREFLVTSPPEHCATPETGRIEGVRLEWKLLSMLVRAEPDDGWTPLILALRHAERPPPPPRPGPAILGPIIATQQQ